MKRYLVNIRTTSGFMVKQLSEFNSLTYGRADRSIYSCEIIIPANEIDLGELEPDLIIEIWRYNDLHILDIEAETVFFLRTWNILLDTEGKELLKLYGLDSLYVLTSRINAYYAEHTNAALSGYARTLLRNVVYNNFAAGAIVARQIGAAYFDLEAAVGSGASITKSCAWQQVPSLLNDIVNQSRDKGYWITYDVVYDGSFPLIFRTFADQRGGDKRSSIILTPENKNISEPNLIFDYSDEVTASYLLAAGEKAQRVIGRADSARVAISPFSRIEGKKENTQISVQASADNEAQELLEKHKGKVYFSGKIVQVDSMRYGIDWGYGDKLKASWKGYDFDCRVVSFEARYSNSGTMVDEISANVIGES